MACEFDANDMATLATAQKIKPTVLLTERATRANLLKAVRAGGQDAIWRRSVLPHLFGAWRPDTRRER